MKPIALSTGVSWKFDSTESQLSEFPSNFQVFAAGAQGATVSRLEHIAPENGWLEYLFPYWGLGWPIFRAYGLWRLVCFGSVGVA